VNFGYALMCPVGAALFLFGIRAATGHEPMIAAAALAFSAGVFVSIALSDLLPEVQFHSHDRLKLSLAVLFGALVAWSIGWFEPSHAHGG
jgi:zinc and cadmium transporter